MGSLAAVALALYRKYRPAKFSEVVGQEHVTEPLSTALASGRINHAYLFSGPRGCGKTSSARILARSLNCEQGPTPDPCGVCASCVSLAPGGPGNIDVTELDAASHGGVDDTRELRDRAFFAPAESRYRVFIVDEAHMITTQGFNALLKIVEEPPEHLVFVFATTEPDKVLPTIRSRTHHYPFRLIPPGTLRKLLERICAEEGAVVAPPVYPLVLRAGGGSARDTLSVLDQLLAGAGPEGVTYERAVALLGVTDVALIDDMVDALAAGDRAAVFEAVDRLVEAGHDPRRFAADLLQRLRDLVLLQSVPEAAERGLVEAADDEIARMVEQAGKFGVATLTRYGEIVHTGLTEMRGATAPRLLLELLCARMLLPAATTAESGLLERLERLERRSAIASAPPGQEDDAPGEARRTFRRPSAPSASRTDGSGSAEAEPASPPTTPAPDSRPGTDGSRPARPAAAPVRTERPDRAGPAPQPPAAQPPPPNSRPPSRRPPNSRPPSRRPPNSRPPSRRPPNSRPPSRRPPNSRPPSRRPPNSQALGRLRPSPLRPSPARCSPLRCSPLRRSRPRSRQPWSRPVRWMPRRSAGCGRRCSPRRARRAAASRRCWSTPPSGLWRATPSCSGSARRRSPGVSPSRATPTSSPPRCTPCSGCAGRCGASPATHPPRRPPGRGGPPRRSGPGDAPQRPQQASPPVRANRPPPARRPSAPDDGVPLPPEPPDEDAPPEDDEEAMLAEAAVPVRDAERRDPEEAAIELLTSQLGARAIDRR